MTKINKYNFGSIVIDGKEYVRDVLILTDGTIKEREPSKAGFSSHKITWGDIAKIANGQPQVIVIGTGASGLAKLSLDAGIKLRKANLNLLVLSSSQAVDKFNQLTQEGKRVAALIHITC
jgi:hypothetical protein